MRYFMSDLHVFTTQSAKTIFGLCGHDPDDRCLSGHWRFFYDSDPSLTLPITRDEAAAPYSHAHFEMLARKFSAWFTMHNKQADFTYCSFTSKLAHIFRYVDAPIQCQLSFRFDDNHPLPAAEAESLRDLLISMQQSGKMTLTANNRYDEMYFYYYTGLRPTYIPPTGSYVTSIYEPASDLILIGPGRHYPYGESLMASMAVALRKRLGTDVCTIQEAFPNGFSWRQLASCKAIVIIPYAVSSGAFFEYLAMGIPLFFPSVRLLTEWHCENFLLVERKPSLRPARSSEFPAAVSTLPDPKNDFDKDAVSFWLKYCDWYYWDGARIFDSLEELHEMLATMDAPGLSERLLRQSRRDLELAARSWPRFLA